MDGAIGEPGQELNIAALPGQTPGSEQTPARQAATVILLRDGAEGLEVLLVKRNEKARFMGGVWVFPGGALDGADGAEADPGGRAHRAAAARELAEEASVALPDPAELVEFSRWITPAQVTVRFDTRFFLAALPDGQSPRVDGQECVELGWFTPQGALDAHARGEIALVFPTIKHLEQLRAFASVAELLEHARGLQIRPVQPRVTLEGEVARILLPGEPGYED
ncbi:MAG TPA: NUDIX domain-containing protein [Solirubrobacteraceae bacterium]|jgi:8-oxo-dGTP pyrophosphatase MutT (NUDIX family)|nr:NUDIX domain-containing protein [Solirubrobacteraceae bacterium]